MEGGQESQSTFGRISARKILSQVAAVARNSSGDISGIPVSTHDKALQLNVEHVSSVTSQLLFEEE